MVARSNIHTHSTFCDGKSTIEEVIKSAISFGFQSIGFSSHAYTGFDFDECGIVKERVDEYFETLDLMKEKYRDRIEIFRGLELESRVLGDVRPTIDPRCEYTIGSCHMVKIDGRYISVDDTPEKAREAISLFGSPLDYAEYYFNEVASFAEDTDFDIVGHFDLITKFNEKEHLFDDEDPEYRKLALHYLERTARTGKIFEVNTGAISRGWKSVPYPAVFLLERLHALGSRIILTSDSHHASTLTCDFDRTEALLRDIGFAAVMQLTGDGFVEVTL